MIPHAVRVVSSASTVKEHRRFEFDNDNMKCRICDGEPETLVHVLCRCGTLCEPAVCEGDEYSSDMKTLEMVAARMSEFVEKVDCV